MHRTTGMVHPGLEMHTQVPQPLVLIHRQSGSIRLA